MEMAIMIEIQSRKLITPFVQTHSTLSHYKLGFIDECMADVDVGVVLFFSTNNNYNQSFAAQLENSLSKTLIRFYPLAGRYIKETRTVNCKDQGVELIYAKVNIQLQDFISSEENVKYIDKFNPTKIGVSQQPSDRLLAIQITTFECGGLAIGVCGSHKIVDASSLCTLINEWAATNRKQGELEFTRPGFNSNILFPARGVSSFPVLPMNDEIFSKYTRLKLLFSESVISTMKVKGKNSTFRWSKVQLVSAIIWKAFMLVDLAIYKYERESILIQIVNLREKMGSLIPKDSIGNLIGVCVTECTTPETIEELTDRLSDSIKKTITNFSKGFHNCEEAQEIVLKSLLKLTNISESTNVVAVTSWCKLPFYEVDFGYGKPIWTAPAIMPINHTTYLMDDAKENGVEAHVFLEVKDVPYFEKALEIVNSFGV